LANAGAAVACTARREGPLNDLVEKINGNGGKAIAVVEDVSARGAPQRLVSKVESELGPIDILINNAGIARIGAVEREPEDVDPWWRVHEVNVRAPVALSRAVLPGMLERKSGFIITVSSGVLYMTLPAMSAYSSSKAAITKFHEALSIELQGTGVYSFSTTPGMVKTELGRNDDGINPDSMDHPLVQAFMSGVGNATYQDPEVLADLIVSMCVDDAWKSLNGRFINGSKDLTKVIEEARKEGGGSITKQDMYTVRMVQL
jgi:short-subunit dehydrogenase